MAIVRQEAVAEPHTGLALLLAKGGFGYDCLARCCRWWPSGCCCLIACLACPAMVHGKSGQRWKYCCSLAVASVGGETVQFGKRGARSRRVKRAATFDRHKERKYFDNAP